MSLDKLYDEARGIIKNSKHPIALFDSDSDGSTSFLQLRNTFSNIKRGFPIGNDRDSQIETLEEMEDKNDLLIILDKSFICDEIIHEFKDKKILWIDHHVQINKDQIKDHGNIVFINPLLFNKNDERPTSYFTYQLCNEEKNLFWAALGTCSDFFVLDVIVNLYEKDKKAFDILFKIPEDKRKELFEYISSYDINDEESRTECGEWTKYVWYETGYIKYKNFFEFLYKICKTEKAIKTLNKIFKMSPQEFALELSDSKDEIFERFRDIMNEYKEVFSKVKFDSKQELVHIHHENTTVSFNRQIAEETVYRLGNTNWKVVFSSFSKEDKPFISCSFRGNKYNVEKLIVKNMKGLDGRGGGHDYSAGASVTKEDFQEFKKRVYNEFNLGF